MRHRVVLYVIERFCLLLLLLLPCHEEGLEVSGAIQIVVAVCSFLCDGFLSSAVPGAFQATTVLITNFMYSTALDYCE